jgi:hypothetical protein
MASKTEFFAGWDEESKSFFKYVRIRDLTQLRERMHEAPCMGLDVEAWNKGLDAISAVDISILPANLRHLTQAALGKEDICR